MFALGGMLLFPACNNLLLSFVALEVLSLPLYLMAGLARRPRRPSPRAPGECRPPGASALPSLPPALREGAGTPPAPSPTT